MDLFEAPVDEAKVARELEAAGLGDVCANVNMAIYAEPCPKCGADPSELCTSRGKPREYHPARFRVAGLRYETGWMPKTGERVALRDTKLSGLFVRWTPDGEAEVRPTEGEWTYTTFDALALEPLEWQRS